MTLSSIRHSVLTMSKTRRMALVPEETLAALTAKKRATQSPYLRSLINMNLQMQAIFEVPNIPLSRKLALHERFADRYRSMLKQYKLQVPYVRVLKSAKKKKRTPPAPATPVLPAAPPALPVAEDEDEEDEVDEPVLPPTPSTISKPPFKRCRTIVSPIFKKPVTRSRYKRAIGQNERSLPKNCIRY